MKISNSKFKYRNTNTNKRHAVSIFFPYKHHCLWLCLLTNQKQRDCGVRSDKNAKYEGRKSKMLAGSCQQPAAKKN